MAIKKRPSPPAGHIPGLDPAIEDLLVSGPSDDDVFFEFTIPLETIRALVKEHGPALQAEAVRRGLDAFWGAQFRGGPQ